MRNDSLSVGLLCRTHRFLVPVSNSISFRAFESFEFLICITKVLVSWLVGSSISVSSSRSILCAWLISHLVADIAALLQLLLQEAHWTVLCQVNLVLFLHWLSQHYCASTRVYQLLFKVEKLSLEARVWIDHWATCFNMTHGLKKCPVLLLH